MEHYVEIRIPRDLPKTAEEAENWAREYAWRMMIGGVMREHPRFSAARLAQIERRKVEYTDEPVLRFTFDITLA